MKTKKPDILRVPGLDDNIILRAITDAKPETQSVIKTPKDLQSIIAGTILDLEIAKGAPLFIAIHQLVLRSLAVENLPNNEALAMLAIRISDNIKDTRKAIHEALQLGDYATCILGEVIKAPHLQRAFTKEAAQQYTTRMAKLGYGTTITLAEKIGATGIIETTRTLLERLHEVTAVLRQQPISAQLPQDRFELIENLQTGTPNIFTFN